MKKTILTLIVLFALLASVAWIDPPVPSRTCDKNHNVESGWMFLGETESTCIYYSNGENYEIVK